MKKLDHKKELKHLYKPSAKEVMEVDVPQMNFLKIDGAGDPNTSKAFQQAIEALFSVSYTLKFMIKRGELGIDYSVMPPEGLWWADDLMAFRENRKDEWIWKLIMMQPDFITKDLYLEAMEQVKKKKDLPALPKMRLEPFHEDRAAQIMHIGSYSEEAPTIEKVHSYIRDKGFQISGKHHEIYLSDIRRTVPKRLKTVIRQPMD